jgi:hypothetical protein
VTRLRGPEHPHAASLEIHHIVEANEMDTVLIEGVPACALGVFAVTLEIRLERHLIEVVVADAIFVIFVRHMRSLFFYDQQSPDEEVTQKRMDYSCARNATKLKYPILACQAVRPGVRFEQAIGRRRA